MKKCKKLIILLLTVALSLIAVCISGCIASSVKSFLGDWQLNFSKTIGDAGKYFESVNLSVSAESIDVSVKYTGDFVENNYTCEIKQAEYDIVRISSYGSSELGFSFKSGNIELYGGMEKNTLWIRNCAIRDEEGFLQADICLYFTKTNKTHSGNHGGNANGDSKFEDIKAAYKNAGYSIDLGQDSLDESTAQLAKSIADMYAALGYDICILGKNLDNILNTELYMLISTPSEKETQEIVDAYKDAYKYAVNGKDVIISIWPMGTPNFTPFNNATK